MKTLTQDQKDAILADLNSGMKLHHVARAMKIPPPVIRYNLRTELATIFKKPAKK